MPAGDELGYGRLGEANGAGTLAARPGRLHRLLDSTLIVLARDFPLFLVGASTDASIERTRSTAGARAAFEAAYTKSPDPWASASPRYRYQQRKYEQIMAMLPKRRFVRALDIGCGLGLLSQLLAGRADNVLGIDIASAAVERARQRGAAFANLEFAQGDLLDLPRSLDGRFDLVVVADVLYYLQPLDDGLLNTLAARIADLLRGGGICVVANHFFFTADSDSRLARRIHNAFMWSPRFAVLSEHRHAFFLVSVMIEKTASGTDRLAAL